MQKTKGISLIVLVITIIVMIILAGAIILTLNNSGIIDKASDAVQKSDEATIKEIAQMAWGAVYAEYGADQEMLEQGVKTALIANNLNPEDYGMVVTTSGVEITKGWLQHDSIVTKGTQTLEIGDTVNYVATGTDYEGIWKVLGAESGELLIVSADNVQTKSYDSPSNLLLAEKNYVNGVQELNTLCESYGKGEGATGARSIKVEDVNRVTGYNPETSGYGERKINEYGNRITYTWTGNDDPYCVATNGVKGDMEEGYHNGSFTYFDGEKFVTSTNTGATEDEPIEITTLTANYYLYYPTTLTTDSSGIVNGIAEDSKAYVMLFRNSADTTNAYYWLASPYVSAFFDFADFGFRGVFGGKVHAQGFVDSWGQSGGDNYGVRAVVYLDSNIEFTGSSADGWTF